MFDVFLVAQQLVIIVYLINFFGQELREVVGELVSPKNNPPYERRETPVVGNINQGLETEERYHVMS